MISGDYAYALSDEINGTALEKGNDSYIRVGAGLAIGSFGQKREKPAKFVAPIDRPAIPDTASIAKAVEAILPQSPIIPADLQFDTIFFATDAVKFSAAAKSTLETVATALKANPLVTVEIRGYSDKIGTDNLGHSDRLTGPEYNMSVSVNRAVAVRDYLLDQGIAEERMVVKGFGQKDPIAPNTTPEGRKRNRRVDVVPNN